MEKWTRQHNYSKVTGLWSLCWLLECFSVKSFFVRHSFISKMLTKLRPQEQARKLETFTYLKAYKNNRLPFSGQTQGAAAVYITLLRVLEALQKGPWGSCLPPIFLSSSPVLSQSPRSVWHITNSFQLYHVFPAWASQKVSINAYECM